MNQLCQRSIVISSAARNLVRFLVAVAPRNDNFLLAFSIVIPAEAGIQEKTVNDPPEDAVDELALMPLAGKE